MCTGYFFGGLKGKPKGKPPILRWTPILKTNPYNCVGVGVYVLFEERSPALGWFRGKPNGNREPVLGRASIFDIYSQSSGQNRAAGTWKPQWMRVGVDITWPTRAIEASKKPGGGGGVVSFRQKLDQTKLKPATDGYPVNS